MNIFQQVFASVNVNEEKITPIPKPMVSSIAKPKLPDPAKSEETAPAAHPVPLKKKSSEQTNTIHSSPSKRMRTLKRIVNGSKKPKAKHHPPTDYTRKIAELEHKLQEMKKQLEETQESLKTVQESNVTLSKRKDELEELVGKMDHAAQLTAAKMKDMKADFEEIEKERNECWEFRCAELEIELEALRERNC